MRCDCDTGPSVTFRYNPDKAGRTEIGSHNVHNAEDTCDSLGRCCSCCYDSFGWTGIGLLTIASVGVLFLAAASKSGLSWGKDCIEICSYDQIGHGICSCIFH